MLSRLRTQSEDTTSKGNKDSNEPTTATIRGLDPELYNWAMARAKESGHNIGELINEAIAHLKTSSKPPKGVMDIAMGTGELRLSKGILSNLETKIRVFGIGRVGVEETVQPSDLDMVYGIEGCGTVLIPEKLYAHVMGKIKGCGQVRTFSGSLDSASAGLEPRIGGVEELVLSQADLEQLDDGTTIDAGSRLSLMSDVRLDTFQKKVGRIRGNGDTVIEASRQLRIAILKRAHNISRVNPFQDTQQDTRPPQEPGQ